LLSRGSGDRLSLFGLFGLFQLQTLHEKKKEFPFFEHAADEIFAFFSPLNQEKVFKL
jgi:hypothetical protein